MKYLEKKFNADMVILAIGKVLQMLLLLLAVRLFTTYLPDEEVGNLILIIAIGSFFGLAVVNPVGSFINRRLYEWKKRGEIGLWLFSFNYYVCAISLLAMSAPYILLVIGVGESINTFVFSLALLFYIYFNTWNQTVIPSLNLLFFRKAFIFFTLFSIAAYLVLSSILVHFINASALWWLVGQTTGLALGFIVALPFFIQCSENKKNIKFVRFEWSGILVVADFALPLAAATFFLWVLGNSYKLIIDASLSAKDLAYIGLGLGLATSLAGAIESLLMQVFHAHFYKGLSVCDSQEDRTALFQEFVNNTIPPISAIIFVLIIISPFLLSVIADHRFLGAYMFLMVGLLIEFLRVSTNIVGHAAYSELKTKTNIQPYFWGSIIASISIYLATFSDSWRFLIPIFIIISWFITLRLMIKSAKRLLNFQFPWKDVFRMILFSSPIVIVGPFWNMADSLLVSILIIFLSGLFSVGILYLNYTKRWGNA